MFHQFALLPAEIRHLIWDFYLTGSPRIHVLHETGPAPPSRTPRRDEVLPYSVTTLDAATNAQTPTGLRSAWVNQECRAVARRLRLHRTILHRNSAIRLAQDLQRSAPGPVARGGCAVGRGPVHMDWSSDLIFICSPSNEQAFRNMAETPWTSKIQRLAVLVPRRCESNIPFGPGYVVSHILRPMVSLKEIYVVMIPFVRPAPDPTGRGNSWGRDRYGFVSYVDYLKEICITTREMSQGRHMTYQRTALSLMHALGKHLEMPGVSLRKVVDVDCSLFTESAYARRGKWLGLKPSES